MLSAIAIVFLLLAGLVKGAVGAGLPVVAVPALSMLYDVKLAVAIMMVPNLVTNVWQGWVSRHAQLPPRFVWSLALAGALGAGFGSWLLATLPPRILSLAVAFSVLAYVLFRLFKTNWVLEYTNALRISIPVGLLAGTLQGSTGISAPVSLAFLNAMRLERNTFIATVSIYFIAMTVVQIPVLASLGIMRFEHFILGTLALVPILGMMYLGQWLARHVQKSTFDVMLLVMLVLMACGLIVEAM